MSSYLIKQAKILWQTATFDISVVLNRKEFYLRFAYIRMGPIRKGSSVERRRKRAFTVTMCQPACIPSVSIELNFSQELIFSDQKVNSIQRKCQLNINCRECTLATIYTDLHDTH